MIALFIVEHFLWVLHHFCNKSATAVFCTYEAIFTWPN